MDKKELVKDLARSAVGFLALAVIANIVLDKKSPPPQSKQSPAQQACLNEVTEMMQMVAQADGARASRHGDALVGLAGNPAAKNAAVADSAMAAMDAEDRQAAIREESAICSKLASCYPDKPYEKVFNTCYSKAIADRKADDGGR